MSPPSPTLLPAPSPAAPGHCEHLARLPLLLTRSSPSAGRRCDTVVDGCKGKPCRNGGTCAVASNTGRGFICKCPPVGTCSPPAPSVGCCTGPASQPLAQRRSEGASLAPVASLAGVTRVIVGGRCIAVGADWREVRLYVPPRLQGDRVRVREKEAAQPCRSHAQLGRTDSSMVDRCLHQVKVEQAAMQKSSLHLEWDALTGGMLYVLDDCCPSLVSEDAPEPCPDALGLCRVSQNTDAC